MRKDKKKKKKDLFLKKVLMIKFGCFFLTQTLHFYGVRNSTWATSDGFSLPPDTVVSTQLAALLEN